MENIHSEGEIRSDDIALYSRAPEVDEEAFEGDLLLMHRTLQTVILLNPAAAVLWEALQWPVSKQDLADVLVEAHPEVPVDSALAKVSETLELLAENNFITEVAA